MHPAVIGVVALINYASTARILGIAPTPSYSHQRVFQPIWRELSLRGHEVIVITTDPISNSSLRNLTEIDVHAISYNIWNENVQAVLNARQQSIIQSLNLIINSNVKIAEMQFQNEEVQALIKNETERFDLVILEFLLPVYFAFGEHFKCPFIGITSMNPPSFLFNFIGNPNHPAVTPDDQYHYDEKLTLFQRVLSAFVFFTSELLMELLYSNQQQLIANKYFGKDMPPLHAIGRNISLLFINTEPVFHSIMPLVPSLIQIGGGNIHRSTPKPLPNDLKKKLDEATRGFIYFSLGSNVKSKDLSAEKLKIIVETFSEVPFEILWKFEFDDLPNKSANIIISKWVPQESVLEHPNIKLFITQGGLQSLDEAIACHVPMIGIPFFADQFYNVRKMVSKGMGVSLDYKTLNKEEFKRKIIEVITNLEYKRRVVEIDALIKDQPMTGLEKVIWWTEYVLRHKGAKHLRSPFLDLPLNQFLMLDVVGVVVILMIFIIVMLVMFGKCVVHFTKKIKKKVD